jgi:DNA-directed RNA polymerase specialized sigma24 family protein
MPGDDRSARAQALFETHWRGVLAYARRRASYATADEVLSDVFMVAWRRLDDVPAEADALPWLLACARNALANHRRAQRRRVRLVARLRPTVSDELPVGLHDGMLAEALARLGSRDREALLLSAWEGLTAPQAAAVLGCSPEAFRVRLHRARKRLAQGLEPLEASAPEMTMEARNE